MINPIYTEDAIPVILAFDDNYFNYAYVAINSLIKKASKNRNYDIYILYQKIHEYNKELLLKLSRENISIKFIDINENIKNYEKHLTLNNDITITTYYRLWIPTLFKKYDKVLYLDSDIVVLDDVAKLYDTEIGNNWFGVITDMGIGTKLQKNLTKYVQEKLLIKDTMTYFNAGVLLFNIKELTKFDFLNKAIETLIYLKKPLVDDQDVLNVLAKGKTYMIDWVWNAQTMCFTDYAKQFLKDFIKNKKDIHEKCLEKIKNAKILHYTSGEKPWKNPYIPKSEYFWMEARQTPVYERILYSNMRTNTVISKIKYTFLEKIFSLKNHGKHKIVTLCGIKLKLKRKKK